MCLFVQGPDLTRSSSAEDRDAKYPRLCIPYLKSAREISFVFGIDHMDEYARYLNGRRRGAQYPPLVLV